MSDRVVRRTSVAAVLLVAAVAATCSYAHLYDLATAHGEGWRASLVPLSIDGMLVAATLAIVSQRRQRKPAGWVPWLGLVLGILASLAGNVAAAHADVIARLIAGWPPAALAVSIETLVVILRDAPAVEPVAEPAVVVTPEPVAAKVDPTPTVESAPRKSALTSAERQKAYRERKKQERMQQPQFAVQAAG